MKNCLCAIMFLIFNPIRSAATATWLFSISGIITCTVAWDSCGGEFSHLISRHPSPPWPPLRAPAALAPALAPLPLPNGRG